MDCTFENFALAGLLENWILSTIWPHLACFRTPLLLRGWWARHKSKKAKCTLVQALRLCTGHTAHMGSRGIALLFLDQGTRRGWGVSVMPWPLFTPGKDPPPIVQETGWAPRPVWTSAVNLAPTRIWWRARPAQQDCYVCCIMGPSLQYISQCLSMQWKYFGWPVTNSFKCVQSAGKVMLTSNKN